MRASSGPTPKPLSDWLITTVQKMKSSIVPEREREHRDVRQHRGRLGALEERRVEEADRAEQQGGGEQDELLADDVVDRRAAVHEHDGGDRDGGHDHEDHEGECGRELAEDDRRGPHRRAHQQVEGLLLALEADLAGGERRRDEADEDDLEDREGREDRLPDERRCVRLAESDAAEARRRPCSARSARR